jgi:cleavage stimulation factor subunit 3
VLKDEDVSAYRTRILYVYKQALMALRFWPEMWFEAAEFCFQNHMDTEGDELLVQGSQANSESCLLTFRRADRLEMILPQEEGDEGLNRRGAGVREPYDKLLDSLYELLAKNKTKESQDLARIEQAFEAKREAKAPQDEEERENSDAEKALNTAENEQRAVVQKGAAAQEQLLSRMISFVWIALMRAMRRVQGKGSINGAVGGSRQIFADARKRGKILTDVYAASALMEYHCYKDPAANKIFDRGARLFPEDAEFALQYLKHLVAINDVTSKYRYDDRLDVLTINRCSSILRDCCEQAGTKAREHSELKTNLFVLP